MTYGWIQVEMIEYRTAFARCAEFWFGEPEGAGRFDAVIRYRAPVRSETGKCTDFFTLHVDLTRNAEEIFQAFARNTRAQIRKSIDGDDFRFEFMDRPTLVDLEAFIDFYDRFADANKLSRMHVPRMAGLLNSGALSLTRVATPDRVLTWHANVSRNAHVGMLFSASHLRLEESPEIRKMIGRANRRLHWEEMLRFKQQGRKVYDFGGWYEGTEDSQMLSINRFKEEFGGSKILTYTIVEDRTLRAKCKTVFNQIRRALLGSGRLTSLSERAPVATPRGAARTPGPAHHASNAASSRRRTVAREASSQTFRTSNL